MQFLKFSADSEGGVPLWEAILGRQQEVMKLLADNGAKLCMGDVGQYACRATEDDSLELLEDIVNFGGDVTLPGSSGSTALHRAVCDGNLPIVSFLLDHGANPDKPDVNGWTPRNYADQQGHEEIKVLFQSKKECNTSPSSIAVQLSTFRYMGRFRSEPTLPPPSREFATPPLADESSGRNRLRRKSINFQNSLFGIMSAAGVDGDDRTQIPGPVTPMLPFSRMNSSDYHLNTVRVTISCPEKSDVAKKLILLPASLGELLNIGAQKFGCSLSKVLTVGGAEVDDIEVIRDGDHLLLVSDNGFVEGVGSQMVGG